MSNNIKKPITEGFIKGNMKGSNPPPKPNIVPKPQPTKQK